MHTLYKISACILTGTLILSGMSSNVKADENRINTDHNTYYIGNDTEVTPDPEPSEPTEPVTPAPTPVPQPPKEDGSTATDTEKKEPSIGDIVILPEPDVPDTNDDTNDIINAPSEGYISSVKNALKLDNYISLDWSKFITIGNPFELGQCTYFAWSRFYQVYGFSSGAFGNGKDNAREIVSAHGNMFNLSSTPSGGAVFSTQKNTLYPQCGHVGFVEAFDGTNLWISEGNYKVNGKEGYIHIYRTTFQAFKAMYPDVVFAVPNGSVLESSLLSDLSLYSMDCGLNVTNTSANDSKVNMKKLKYKNTKRKNTIYYENGEKIQQYKFKPADEKVTSEV